MSQRKDARDVVAGRCEDVADCYVLFAALGLMPEPDSAPASGRPGAIAAQTRRRAQVRSNALPRMKR